MGYHSSCGRFFCAQHSHGKLCDECAAEQESEQIYNQYIQACFAIRKAARKKAWISVGIIYAVMFPVMLLFSIFANNSSSTGVSPGLPVLLLLLVLMLTIIFLFFFLPTRFYKKEKNVQLDIARGTYSEIDTFYREWSRSNSRNAWKVAGFVTLGLIAAAMPSRVESDLHRIQNKLDSLR
jgi:hypothetical protein